MPLLDYEPMFRVPGVVETAFFTSSETKNKDFAKTDLEKSGLEPKDIAAKFPPMLQLPKGAIAGYIIPYFDLNGKPITDSQGNLVMFRTRLQWPEFSREARYIQPSSDQLIKYGLPPILPYIHPKTLELSGETLICAEGEKKTASILKYIGIPAFGIGGFQMWRNPDGSGTIHPWIRELIRIKRVSSITIVPDGDIFRYDICQGYGTFARALESEGITVNILNPEGKIDDLIVRWGKDAPQRFSELERIGIDRLVQPASSLVKKYGLAFKLDSKDRVSVYEHTSNVMRLMEEHNAFPKFWRNLDNNSLMVGDKQAEPELTEMEIANYFQHNLGMHRVTHRMIRECMGALARKNSRSPFLEYIKSVPWDGKPRLDTWLTRLWGVEDTPFSREVASKWLISACARLHKPGTKIDWMLIVVGPQGVGKTSMPSILFKGNTTTLYGEHNHKDLHLLLHSNLCIGFDELDSFGKKESSNLKAMVTTNEDAFRPPYGSSVEVFPRRFTLYGCGNRYEFLQYDPSGYRRYPVIEVTRLLDFAGLEAERDQLWAEAWHRYLNGNVNYWEVSGASENAERYAVPNMVEDMVTGWIESQKANKSSTNVRDGYLYFTMTQLMIGINMEREGRNPHVTREVAAILRALGAVQENSRKTPVPGVFGRYYKIKL